MLGIIISRIRIGIPGSRQKNYKNIDFRKTIWFLSETHFPIPTKHHPPLFFVFVKWDIITIFRGSIIWSNLPFTYFVLIRSIINFVISFCIPCMNHIYKPICLRYPTDSMSLIFSPTHVIVSIILPAVCAQDLRGIQGEIKVTLFKTIVLAIMQRLYTWGWKTDSQL